MTEQIESEVKRERLTEIITRWCRLTKTSHLLRDYDIPGLVRQILDEFYRVSLCCGHRVGSLDEGVCIAFKDAGEEVSGSYCKACAEKYKRELGAWEVKG